MLVVGDFNIIHTSYQNVKVHDNVMVSDLSCDLQCCTMYIVLCHITIGFSHMLDSTNLKILTDNHAFFMINVLTCLLALGGGSVLVDYN